MLLSRINCLSGTAALTAAELRMVFTLQNVTLEADLLSFESTVAAQIVVLITAST